MRKSIIVITTCLFLFSCATEESDFQKAVNANTLEAYDQFMAKYPESEFQTIAKDSMLSLGFKNAVSFNNIDSLQHFLEMYQDTRLDSLAHDKIHHLQFEEALQKNTISIYEQFIKDNPDNPLIAVAQDSILSHKYSIALERNFIKAFKDFQENYPKSRFDKQARERLAALKRKARQAAKLVELTKDEKYNKVKSLVKKGYDINAKTTDGSTALETAIDEIDEKGVKLLLSLGARATASELYSAVWMSRLYMQNAFSMALGGFFAEQGVETDPNAKYVSHLNILKMIIDTGVNVNAANQSGRTALHIAVRFGNEAGGYEHAPKMAKLLLAAGANPDLPDSNGRSPRDRAKNPQIIKLFETKAGGSN